MREIVKLFERGNVIVVGLKGTGKDTLMGNVAVRRNKPYVSNTYYGKGYNKFHPRLLFCGGNTFRNFINEDVLQYKYPFPDGTDIYIGDAGVYFPAHANAELDKEYGQIATFMALSRHLGDCSVHINCQNLNRIWLKLREMSDTYIMCMDIKWVWKIAIQRVRIYEVYDSAVKKVPPFRLPKPLLSPERRFQWKVQKQNYDIAYGEIKSKLLIYWNRSKHNPRIFKEVLENGKVKP